MEEGTWVELSLTHAGSSLPPYNKIARLGWLFVVGELPTDGEHPPHTLRFLRPRAVAIYTTSGIIASDRIPDADAIESPVLAFATSQLAEPADVVAEHARVTWTTHGRRRHVRIALTPHGSGLAITLTMPAPLATGTVVQLRLELAPQYLVEIANTLHFRGALSRRVVVGDHDVRSQGAGPRVLRDLVEGVPRWSWSWAHDLGPMVLRSGSIDPVLANVDAPSAHVLRFARVPLRTDNEVPAPVGGTGCSSSDCARSVEGRCPALAS